MEVDMKERWKPRQVIQGIDSIPLDEFFDCLRCIEQDAVWWSLNIIDLVHKKTEGLHISTEKEYAMFTGDITKPNAKRIVYLRLANLEKDNEGEEENLLV